MYEPRIIEGDAIASLKLIPDKSVKLILSDHPYGTTKNTWDKKLNLDLLWPEYWRVLEEGGCIALWSQQPYTTDLIVSQREYFRYEWVIEKTKPTGHLNSKRMPMKAHENVLIFYKQLPAYNPQITTGHKPVNSYTKHQSDGSNYGATKVGVSGGGQTDRFPKDVLKFKWDTQTSKLNPTQKPVAANDYFIKTYTNEGDTVLDNCAGSGSTGMAAMVNSRHSILIDNDIEQLNNMYIRFFGID